MERKPNILFLDTDNACQSVMAEALLVSLAATSARAWSAGITPTPVGPTVVKVMREVGIDVSQHTPQGVADLRHLTFDLVVTLTGPARDHVADPPTESDGASGPSAQSALLVGLPVHLHWSVPAAPPAREDRPFDEGPLRAIRDLLREHVRCLLDQGFLPALRTQRDRMERIVDSLDDGLVAHDRHRRVFLFNRAAERMTGLARTDVLGRSCQTVFSGGGLCGAECPFQDGPATPFLRQQHLLAHKPPTGGQKRIKVSLAPLPDGAGVVATLRDVTEVSELRWSQNQGKPFHGMIGLSASMTQVFESIRQVAPSDYPVLVTGESGTGKELVASAIHAESRRREGPFVPINCGALPETILESELFGHVRGAFTGAVRDKKGRFELADGGTLFLDEVGELSPSFQVKLLRVLQEKRFEPVGSERTVVVDVRVIGATNRDLRSLVREGLFREDLFFRIAVVPIRLAPLRDRPEDVVPLVAHMLELICRETGKVIHGVSPETMAILRSHPWPGNVRELINALRLASVRCTGDLILPQHLPSEVRETPATGRARTPQDTSSAAPPVIRRGRLTAEAVRRALEDAGGNKVRAAELLGVGRATLYRFLTREMSR